MSLQAEMIQKQLLEANMEEGLDYISNKIFAKPLRELSDKEAYYVILLFTKDLTLVTDRINGEKKIFYMSAEFLIGRLLSNNLINLGIYDKVAEV
ncbi:MAG: maltose phosphorylase, partial [Lachnospiraceae bacterium]|nr:maltose phosphorylase [Lachnospiraceae bacterium]